MDKKKLQDLVLQAEDLTNNIKVDGNFRQGLFQVILLNLISGLETRPIGTDVEKNKENQPVGTDLERSSIGDLIQLAKKTGLSEDELKDLFDMSADGIQLTSAGSLEGSVAEKQQEVVISYLTAAYYCYGKDRESADFLRELCENLGIVDKGKNFSRNLASVSGMISPIGKRKSAQKLYKITILGREEGLKLIKRLAKGNEG